MLENVISVDPFTSAKVSAPLSVLCLATLVGVRWSIINLSMPMYIVRKWIRANSLKDALRKEKDVTPTECYLSDSGMSEVDGKNEGNKEVKGLSK